MSESDVEKKKPYEKPELKIIEMKEEEVLAIGCKMAGGSTQAFGNPTCIASQCVSQGS